MTRSAVAPSAAECPLESIGQVFHSALVSSFSQPSQLDLSLELGELSQSAPFQAILKTVQDLSRQQGLSERDAAFELIRTFRRVDQIWRDYLILEGADRVQRQS